MSESRTTSTLDLVVDEQQMSQIDLRPDNQQQHRQPNDSSAGGFEQLKGWPQRLRSAFNAKLDEAKSKSDSQSDYIFKLIHEFSSILVWILCFVCTVIVPLVFLFLGLFNLDNCSDRAALPYLVFAIGFVMTVSNLFNLALSIDLPVLTNHQVLSADLKNIVASIVNVIFNCLAAFLYIICAYMVYTVAGHQNPETDATNDTYSPNCGSFLYNFTFWFISITLMLSGALCLIALALFFYNRYRLALIRGSTPVA